MIKKFAILITVVALSGCVPPTYTFEGQKYAGNEKLQQAIDSTYSDALSTITPLPTPLTQRKLVFAIPSEATFVDENTKRFVKERNLPPTGRNKEILEVFAKGNYKAIKVFFHALQKKNIYAWTQFIEMQSMTGSFAASADTDTLYFVEPSLQSTNFPSPDSGQWFYTSLKHGKQIFAYDRSSGTPAGRVRAFVDAVQVQAIRD